MLKHVFIIGLNCIHNLPIDIKLNLSKLKPLKTIDILFYHKQKQKNLTFKSAPNHSTIILFIIMKYFYYYDFNIYLIFIYLIFKNA